MAPLKKTMDEVEATRKEVEKGAAKLNRDLKEAQRKVPPHTRALSPASVTFKWPLGQLTPPPLGKPMRTRVLGGGGG